MEYIRLLSLKLYDRTSERFFDYAFKNSGPAHGGGISIIDSYCACAQVTSECLCAHIRRFYHERFPEPCAYWRFDTGLLPEHTIEEIEGTTGDPCHRNIRGVSSGTAKAIFEQNQSADSLTLCADNHSEPFTPARAAALYERMNPES